MEMSAILFYLLASMVVICSLAVIMAANPIHSALYLAVTMVSLAFVFFLLNASFIAGVQLIVYAGAVMVLFVMVVMLFDLKKEKSIFSKGQFTGFIKVASAGWLCGLIAATSILSAELVTSNPLSKANLVNFAEKAEAKNLAIQLFSKYLFAFEALGLLLLLIAVGAVSISRIKGGTHAK